MERKIVYGENGPHIESTFEIFLNFALRLAHKAVKGASSFVNRVFPSGVDGKKIIKE